MRPCRFITIFQILLFQGQALQAAPLPCFLSKNGIKHTLIEKAIFPRDKICGDALSGKVISILKSFDEQSANELSANQELFNPCKGVIFVSPNNTKLSIPFKLEYKAEDKAPGFVSKRLDFDAFLFNKTESPFCHRLQNCELTGIEKLENGLKITTTTDKISTTINTKLLIAADGSRSLAAKQLGGMVLDKNHYSGGIRAYYSGVKNLHNEGYIELIFLKNYQPSYFWIFPLPNGKANVGAGMLSNEISKQRVDLKKNDD